MVSSAHLKWGSVTQHGRAVTQHGGSVTHQGGPKGSLSGMCIAYKLRQLHRCQHQLDCVDTSGLA